MNSACRELMCRTIHRSIIIDRAQRFHKSAIRNPQSAI
ncbi:hypothetical protein D1AOALGA4SA_1718 [Olavius algarvensis Delta 1 endosymbiont]|nr:hypothetical protein D1AOALGA4SA_1718 [Olavius algarvensis Delta 1 endosymbiont]